jgi:hypothetical protein
MKFQQFLMRMELQFKNHLMDSQKPGGQEVAIGLHSSRLKNHVSQMKLFFIIPTSKIPVMTGTMITPSV